MSWKTIKMKGGAPTASADVQRRAVEMLTSAQRERLTQSTRAWVAPDLSAVRFEIGTRTHLEPLGHTRAA